MNEDLFSKKASIMQLYWDGDLLENFVTNLFFFIVLLQ